MRAQKFILTAVVLTLVMTGLAMMVNGNVTSGVNHGPELYNDFDKNSEIFEQFNTLREAQTILPERESDAGKHQVPNPSRQTNNVIQTIDDFTNFPTLEGQILIEQMVTIEEEDIAFDDSIFFPTIEGIASSESMIILEINQEFPTDFSKRPKFVDDNLSEDEKAQIDLLYEMFLSFRNKFGTSNYLMSRIADLEPIIDIGLIAIIGGVVSNQNRDDKIDVGDIRNQIQSWIEMNPGVHLRELQRCLGCSMGAIQYHLIQLESQGMIRSLMNGKTKHLFSPEFSADEQVLQFVALARNPMIKMILKICLISEATTQAELSRIMDIDVSVVSYYVGQMLESKILKIIPVFGREKPLMITEWTMDCIHSLGLVV